MKEKTKEKKPYGGCGIKDCEGYLKERYGADPVLEKDCVLPLEVDTNLQMSGRQGAENCSVAAVARVTEFWCGKMNVKFPHYLADTYQVAEVLAASKYRYTAEKGLSQLRIKPLLHETAHRYGINLDCSLHFLWNYKKHIEGEIDAGRPVILNIALGYYGNHSVTVAGYRVYGCGGKKITMLCLADGWNEGLRCIDLNEFRRFPGFKGISSVSNARLSSLAR